MNRVELGLLAVLAALPRLANLGGSSLWLDEVIQTKNAAGSLRALWVGLERSDTHPPLDTLLSWIQLQLGMPEAYRRCLPAVFGVLTIVILARWASEHFGRGTGWSVGLVAAMSPIHVHYSQELRPYSLALLFMACTLWSFDSLLRRETARRWVFLGLSLLGCAYSLYLSAVVVLAVVSLGAGAAFSADDTRRAASRRLTRRLPLLAAILVAAYLPWLRVALAMTKQPVIKAAEGWSSAGFFRRFEHLAIGGLEGDPGTPWLWLGLTLFVLGTVVAARKPVGWALLVGALAGTVGIQALLVVEKHWTNDRYYLVAWPFVVVLIGVGIGWIGKFPRFKPAPQLLAVGLLALLLVVQVPRIEKYFARGRPDWDWMTRNVAAVAGPGDTIVAANAWTELMLSYYLPRVAEQGAELRVVPERELSRDRVTSAAGCSFLVAAGWPDPGPVIESFEARVRLASDPGGLGGHLYRLTPYADERHCVWALPRSLRSRDTPDRLLDKRAPSAGPLVLDFTPATTEQNLVSGWSRFEANSAGDTFVWATGDRAVLALGGLGRQTRTLGVDVWTLAHPTGPQRMGVELNGEVLEEVALSAGTASWMKEIPGRFWSEDENLLTFRFAHTLVPAELDPGSKDDRALAAAFHRLEVRP